MFVSLVDWNGFLIGRINEILENFFFGLEVYLIVALDVGMRNF